MLGTLSIEVYLPVMWEGEVQWFKGIGLVENLTTLWGRMTVEKLLKDPVGDVYHQKGWYVTTPIEVDTVKDSEGQFSSMYCLCSYADLISALYIEVCIGVLGIGGFSDWLHGDGIKLGKIDFEMSVEGLPKRILSFSSAGLFECFKHNIPCDIDWNNQAVVVLNEMADLPEPELEDDDDESFEEVIVGHLDEIPDVIPDDPESVTFRKVARKISQWACSGAVEVVGDERADITRPLIAFGCHVTRADSKISRVGMIDTSNVGETLVVCGESKNSVKAQLSLWKKWWRDHHTFVIRIPAYDEELNVFILQLSDTYEIGVMSKVCNHVSDIWLVGTTKSMSLMDFRDEDDYGLLEDSVRQRSLSTGSIGLFGKGKRLFKPKPSGKGSRRKGKGKGKGVKKPRESTEVVKKPQVMTVPCSIIAFHCYNKKHEVDVASIKGGGVEKCHFRLNEQGFYRIQLLLATCEPELRRWPTRVSEVYDPGGKFIVSDKITSGRPPGPTDIKIVPRWLWCVPKVRARMRRNYLYLRSVCKEGTVFNKAVSGSEEIYIGLEGISQLRTLGGFGMEIEEAVRSLKMPVNLRLMPVLLNSRLVRFLFVYLRALSVMYSGGWHEYELALRLVRMSCLYTGREAMRWIGQEYRKLGQVSSIPREKVGRYDFVQGYPLVTKLNISSGAVRWFSGKVERFRSKW
jgi:hypothetical protein